MAKIAENGILIKPFLRWAGGKQNLISYLIQYLPKDFNMNGNTYYEPFLGAGSLFLAKCPKKACLTDANEHVINCFKAVKHNPDRLYRLTSTHFENSCEDYYYIVRSQFNKYIYQQTIAQSARFLYLNRTCFNGIFRVNLSGYFNVPYGHKDKFLLPSLKWLRETSAALDNVTLESCCYKNILSAAKKGDFIYMDPPYPPLNGTSYFRHYTKERFDDNDQKDVSDFALKLSEKGCKVLITNADLPFIRSLYSDWNKKKLRITRFITCKSVRHMVNELVITNYDD